MTPGSNLPGQDDAMDAAEISAAVRQYVKDTPQSVRTPTPSSDVSFWQQVEDNLLLSPTARMLMGTGIDVPAGTPVPQERQPMAMQNLRSIAMSQNLSSVANRSYVDPAEGTRLAEQSKFDREDRFKQFVKDVSPDQIPAANHLYEVGAIGNFPGAYGYEHDRNLLNDFSEVMTRTERIQRGWEQNGAKALAASFVGTMADPIYLGMGMLMPGAQGLKVALPARSAVPTLAGIGARNIPIIGSAAVAGHKISSSLNYDATDAPGLGDDLVVFGGGSGMGFAMPFAGYMSRYMTAKLLDSLPSSVYIDWLPSAAKRFASGFDLGGASRQRNLDLLYARLPYIGGVSPKGMSYSASLEPSGRTVVPGNQGKLTAAAPASAVEVPFMQQHRDTVVMLDNLIDLAEKGTFYEDLNLVTLNKLGDTAVDTRIARLRELYDARASEIRAEWDSYREARRSHLSPTDDQVYENVTSGVPLPGKPKPPTTPFRSASRLNFVVHEHADQPIYNAIVTFEQAMKDRPTYDIVASRLRLSGLVADVANSRFALASTPGSRLRTAPGFFGDLAEALVGAPEFRSGDLDPTAPIRVSAEAHKERLQQYVVQMNRRIGAILDEVGGRNRWFKTTNDAGRNVLQEARNILIDRVNAARSVGGIDELAPNPSKHAIRIADELSAWYKKVGKEAVEVGLLPSESVADGVYVSVMLNRDAMRQNRAGFVDAAKAQFRLRDQYVGDRAGYVRLDALAEMWRDNKPMRAKIRDVVRQMVGDPSLEIKSRSQLVAALEKSKSRVVAGDSFETPHSLVTPDELRDMDADVFAGYMTTLDGIHERGANEMWSNLANNARSDQQMFSRGPTGTPAPLKSREVFDVIAPEMVPFLNGDMDFAIRRYAHSMHGQIAVANLIKSNPQMFAGLVRDGKPLANADDLVWWLGNVRSATNELVGVSVSDGMKSGHARKVQGAVERLTSDLEAISRRLIDQTAYADNNKLPEFQTWFSNSGTSMTMLNSGGMMGMSNSLDFGTMLFRAWDNFGRFKASLSRMALRTLPSMQRRDLEHLGLLFQDGRQFLELDSAMSGVSEGGFGDSPAVRGASRKLESTARIASNTYSDANLLNIMNNTSRRAAGNLAMADAVDWSKTLYAAVKQVGNTTDSDAIKAAFISLGGTEYQLGRLSKMGIKAEQAIEFIDNTYKHGYMFDGRERVSAAMSKDEFLADRGKSSQHVVIPNLSEWDNFGSTWMRDFEAAFLNEVRRNYHVTPGVADRPVMMDQYPVLRAVNMFYSYLLAAGPQRLRSWAQMPMGMEARAWAASIASGWIYNTVWNEVRKRQSISESVGELIDRPHVAIYKSIMQSGMLGALTRPIGWMDSLGMGPGTAMDVNYTPGASASWQRYRRTVDKPGEFEWAPVVAGAPINWMDMMGRSASAGINSAITGKPYDPQTAYMMSRAGLFQNYWGFSVINYASERVFGSSPSEYIGNNISPFLSGDSSRMRPPQRTINPFK